MSRARRFKKCRGWCFDCEYDYGDLPGPVPPYGLRHVTETAHAAGRNRTRVQQTGESEWRAFAYHVAGKRPEVFCYAATRDAALDGLHDKLIAVMDAEEKAEREARWAAFRATKSVTPAACISPNRGHDAGREE